MIQTDLFPFDLHDRRTMIGLSGGINSAALLVYLATMYPEGMRPRELFLFYAHLREHSADTARFVMDCIRYAQKHFDCVTWKIERYSVLAFFRSERIIPHPIISPCSERLKIIPMLAFKELHGIELDLVGYVRTERRRWERQRARGAQDKLYPIAHLSDEDCFELVDGAIGWHPAIYDIRDDRGRRVFAHNNCLPCKNMDADDLEAVQKYYPDKWKPAAELSADLDAYWGRPKGLEDFDGDCHYCLFS